MNIHLLKISPKYYHDIAVGLKTFEVRFNDRNYQIGDKLLLCEYEDGAYTGNIMDFTICYILDDPKYVKKGFVILGLEKQSLLPF